MSEAIEERELPGISLKTLITVIVCTGSIMLTVLTTYFNLKADITDVKVSKDSDSKLNDLKMRVIDQRIDAMEIQLKDMSKKMDDDRKK